jgi:hypothetical protein
VASLVGSACAPAPPTSTDEHITDIIAFVERVRGHEFVTDPVVEFLSDPDFEAEVLANLNAEQPGVDADDVAFTAMGWITPAQDLFNLYRGTFGTGVVGFYDPVSKALKVRGTEMTPYRREVIAHELTHALDDQIHDLGDLVPRGLIDEQYLAALVAVEGSAERVRQRYFDSLSPAEKLESINEQLSGGVDPTLLNTPVTLLTLTTAPYLRGPVLQRELAAALGSPAGADASLSDYPDNTEQAFDTDSFLSDEGTSAVPTPPTDAGTSPTSTGEFGPLLLSMLLREGLVLDTLDPLTDAWDGGRYVSWTNGAENCVRIDVAMDSPPASSELQGGLSTWLELHEGGTVVSTSATTTRISRCA